MHDELRERGIEARVWERQFLGSRSLHVDAWMPLPRRLDERLGWVDRSDGVRAKSGDELRRQHAGSATHVEHLLSRANAGEVRERRGELRGIDAHIAVVCVRLNLEHRRGA